MKKFAWRAVTMMYTVSKHGSFHKSEVIAWEQLNIKMVRFMMILLLLPGGSECQESTIWAGLDNSSPPIYPESLQPASSSISCPYEPLFSSARAARMTFYGIDCQYSCQKPSDTSFCFLFGLLRSRCTSTLTWSMHIVLGRNIFHFSTPGRVAINKP